MPRVIEDALVEPVTRALLGAIDVDGGATAEQQAVLAAIVSGYWGRTDLALTTLTPLGPDDAAAAIIGGAHRRRVRELGNLGVHEAGFLRTGALVPKTASLTREGAPELLGEAFRRGSQCRGDFTAADHLALAEVPLAEIRDRFGVPQPR